LRRAGQIAAQDAGLTAESGALKVNALNPASPLALALRTRKAVWMARWTAADLYARDVDALRAELSIADASDELRAAAGDTHEPYRAVLRDVAARLVATRVHAAAEIEREGAGHNQMSDSATPFLAVDDFAAPLLLCHRSLVATGNALIRRRLITDIRGASPRSIDTRAARSPSGCGAT
jgi:phosphoenolpyruvate carboxylase